MSSDPVAPGDTTSQPEDANPEQYAGDPVGDTADATAVDAYTANVEPDVDPRLV